MADDPALVEIGPSVAEGGRHLGVGHLEKCPIPFGLGRRMGGYSGNNGFVPPAHLLIDRPEGLLRGKVCLVRRQERIDLFTYEGLRKGDPFLWHPSRKDLEAEGEHTNVAGPVLHHQVCFASLGVLGYAEKGSTKQGFPFFLKVSLEEKVPHLHPSP